MNAQRLTTILVTFSLLLIGLGATAPSATAAGQAQLTVGHISAPTALTRGAKYLPTASLILRERATSKSRRLATVPRDAVVTANGREGKVYAQVRYGKRTGWVLKKYLSRVYTVNKTYHTLRSVTLYKNRTSTSARVTSVATKRNVTVLMRAGNWSQVKTGTRVGWTATKNLKLGMVPQPINAWYKTNRNSVAVKSSRSAKGTTIGTVEGRIPDQSQDTIRIVGFCRLEGPHRLRAVGLPNANNPAKTSGTNQPWCRGLRNAA